MTDLAELGLVIRSDGVVVARDRLRDFEDQANRTGKATDLLLKAFGALATVLSVTKLVEYTNVWTDLNSRVEIATGSIGQGAATMERLADMARRTYSSLEQTAESFLGNAVAMRDLGYSTGQTLDFVEALNNAFVVSGAKGDRAQSVMNALAKAMALGKLSGDELNTVISTGDRVAEALAASLGVATTDLRKLGQEGKLTGDVIYQALTSQLETLRAEADSMPATIGDAFTLLNNSLLAAVGRFDQVTGASAKVAEAIIWLADAIDDGTISVERIMAVAIAFGAYMAGAWVVSFVAANGAVAALVAGLGLLKAAIISTGVGALVILAGELLYQLYKVVDGADSVEEAMSQLKRSGTETWERIVSAVRWFESVMNQVSDSVVSYMARKWGELIQFIIVQINQLQRSVGVQLVSQDAILGLAEANLQAWERADSYAASAAGHAATAAGHWAAIFGDKSNMSDVGTMPTFGELGGTLGGSTGTGGGGGSGPSAKADEYARLTKSIMENTEALRIEAETMGMSEYQAAKLSTAQELLRVAAEAGRPLTAELIEEISGLANSYAEATIAAEGARLELENRSPWEQAVEDIKHLDEMLQHGAIGWNTYAGAVSKAVGQGLGSLTSMASEAAGLLGQMFEESKEFAIAQAILSGAEGVARTLGAYPFPFNLALAGLHAAAAAGQVAAIMSTNKSSKSMPRAPSGGGSVPATANAPQRQQAERQPDRLDVTLHGLDRNALYSGDNIERLIGLIEERSNDGRILNIKVA